MPETPDFEKIAKRMVASTLFVDAGALQVGTVVTEDFKQRFAVYLADQLRLIWNARGAADTATVEHDLSTLMGATAAGPYLKNLDRALRTLDR